MDIRVFVMHRRARYQTTFGIEYIEFLLQNADFWDLWSRFVCLRKQRIMLYFSKKFSMLNLVYYIRTVL